MPCAFHAERPELFKRIGTACQFDVPENSLIEVDGEKWCEFHAPMLDRAGEKTPKGTWCENERWKTSFIQRILEKIQKANDANQVLDFSGAIFPEGMDFAEKRFPRVCFFRTHFCGDSSFAKAQFGDIALFEIVDFGGDATFNGAVFNHKCSFHKSIFSGHAYFNEAGFSDEADFREALFKGRVSIVAANFGHGASFNKAQFHGEAVFEKTSFSAVDFKQSLFLSPVSFHKTEFGDAEFNASKFNDDALFFEAKFNYCWFSSAQFSIVYFDEAEFRGDICFDDAQFAGLANSSSGASTDDPQRVFQRMTFEGAKFGGEALFNNRHFGQTTVFKYCIFEKAPAFHNCALHQDTDFEGAKFLDTSSAGSARAYRTLKLAMENVRARQEEAMFHALEMKSVRAQADTPISVKLTSYLYERFSNYGQNFLRPVICLGLTFVGFLFFYVGMQYLFSYFLSGSSLPFLENVHLGFNYALDQLIRPFRQQETSEAMKGLAGGYFWIIRLAATLQSVLSLGFLALFLLALRRRFKMD